MILVPICLQPYFSLFFLWPYTSAKWILCVLTQYFPAFVPLLQVFFYLECPSHPPSHLPNPPGQSSSAMCQDQKTSLLWIPTAFDLWLCGTCVFSLYQIGLCLSGLYPFKGFWVIFPSSWWCAHSKCSKICVQEASKLNRAVYCCG